VSFARGLFAVGSSPVLLVGSFLALLALWAAFALISPNVVTSAGGLVQFLALPPGHTVVDVNFLFLSRLPPLAGLALGIALIAFRALLNGFLIAASDASLRGQTGLGEVAIASLRRSLRSFWTLLAFEAGFLLATLVVGTVLIFIGPQAELLSAVWLIGGVYFFVYCEIVAVIEQASPRQALAWGFQAARLPGREHAMLVLIYALFSLLLPTFAARIGGIVATPSIAVWVYALVVAFINVSMLAAFTWRWQVLGEAVKSGAGVRPPRARRAWR
jgi:hypothetical protein